MFFPWQALNGVWPSSGRVIATVRRHLYLRPCISNHLQDFPHHRAVLRCRRYASHCNAQESLEFVLRCFIARVRVIPRISFLVTNGFDPARNVWPMITNKILERCFACEELKEEDTEAIDIGLLGWNVTIFRSLVEESRRSGLVKWVWISKWSETIIGEAGLELGT